MMLLEKHDLAWLVWIIYTMMPKLLDSTKKDDQLSHNFSYT